MVLGWLVLPKCRDGAAGRDVEWIPFKWSGKNSFEARRLAASALSQHLLDRFKEAPEAEHVIIAHSHGGTVSVAAARALDAKGTNLLSRIVSLATPFAQAIPSKRDDRELTMRYMILRFGWFPVMVFFVLLYISRYGGEVFDDVGVFALYYGIMLFVATPILLIGWKSGVIRFRPPAYTGPMSPGQSWSLYAIRSPRDEATVAINTSQFIELVSDILFSCCILRPYDWVWRNRGRVWLSLSIIITILIMLSVFDILRTPLLWQLGTNSFQTLAFTAVGALFTALLLLPWMVVGVSSAIFAAIVLGGSFILIPANTVLAVALGLDVMRFHGLMQIECEPIPSGISGTVFTIELSEEEQNRLGFVHFIHATQAARHRVRQILRVTNTFL
jgi:hypothetical protein